MGELHLEIYVERMRREYNVECTTGKPRVAFRETITQRADFFYTHKKQTGGAGQYARVIGFVEPMERDEETGKDIEFVNQVMGGNIPSNYIPACEKVCCVASRTVLAVPVVLRRDLLTAGAGLLRGAGEGLVVRQFGVRGAHGAQRRSRALGGLVRAGVQAGYDWRVPRDIQRGEAYHPRADHDCRGCRAFGVPEYVSLTCSLYALE